MQTHSLGSPTNTNQAETATHNPFQQKREVSWRFILCTQRAYPFDVTVASLKISSFYALDLHTPSIFLMFGDAADSDFCVFVFLSGVSQGAGQLGGAGWTRTSPRPLVRRSCCSISNRQSPAESNTLRVCVCAGPPHGRMQRHAHTVGIRDREEGLKIKRLQSLLAESCWNCNEALQRRCRFGLNQVAADLCCVCVAADCDVVCVWVASLGPGAQRGSTSTF